MSRDGKKKGDSEKKERMSGAQAMVKSLELEGVQHCFGVIGGAIIVVYDALYDAPFQHLACRHEQGAAHAADGYARATGRVGVCLATSGPGATNLVTGIANAYMDSVPIVAITGQVNTDLIGNDSFQEADITGITLPITKHNYMVKNVKELPDVMKEAFHIARTGRPGPVLVDLPKDISSQELDFAYPVKVNLPGYNPSLEGHTLQIRKAANAIAAADRPVIYAGGGAVISGAHEQVRELAERIGAPVCTTLQAMGVFPSAHPLSLGMVGVHGTRYANFSVIDSDLVIAIGARFDDRVTGKVASFAPAARIIQIDVDPAEHGKNIDVHIPIVGDVKRVLEKLLPLVKAKTHRVWLERVEKWKKEYPMEYDRGTEVIKPQFVVEKISELFPDAIIATEVGQNQMWAAQYFSFSRPRNFISSGGLGTMGYGFPAAMGAQVGRPGEVVFDIAGDGSFQMTSQELATCVQYELPVNIVILNNLYLGMVRQWQELFFNRRYSATDISVQPDFARLAEAYGALGIEVTRKSEVEEALKRAAASDLPAVIDFKVDPLENVYPMVPSGFALNEFVEEQRAGVPTGDAPLSGGTKAGASR